MLVYSLKSKLKFWRTFVFNVPKYTLDYLADFVDLSNKPVFYLNDNEDIEGRNCSLFNQIKKLVIVRF